MTLLDIQHVTRPDDLPPDDLPPDEVPPLETPTGDFNAEFPGSTPEAPYGFKPDGTAYKRRPNGKGGGGKSGQESGKVSTRNEGNARAAASLLARLNLMVVMALHTGNLPKTADAISENNRTFEEMAYNSLVNDPALCRKILGAGAASGKTGLIMAYAFLGVSAVPAIRIEIQERKEARENEQG